MSDYLESLGIYEGDKYIREFHASHFVIKCGGSLVENISTGKFILDDLVFLKKAGINPVLVHGGSVQADKEMEKAGISPQRYKGLRITCDKTIKVLEGCFGALNCDLVERLQKREIGAIGFSATDGGLIQAEKMTVDGVDLGLVGDVTGINEDVWNSIGDDQIPVIASLGVNSAGEVLNINADYVATRLALAVKARKLVLMTDVDGVLLDPADKSTLIPTLTTSHARELIENGTIASGMIPKIESAIRAIEQGLPKIHMINGHTPHSLLFEILTSKGVGTQIIEG